MGLANVFKKAERMQNEDKRAELERLRRQADYKPSDEVFVGDNAPEKVVARKKAAKGAEEFNRAVSQSKRQSEWARGKDHAQRKSEYVAEPEIELDEEEKEAA